MGEIYQDRDLSVLWYDRLYPARLDGSFVQDDIAFYLRQARRARGPILELGCGTGRVALPLARAGFDVTGLDRSAHMLRLAGMKAVLSRLKGRFGIVRGDMSRFRLASRYRLVIVPFRAFQHLLTQQAQRDCLRCVHAHLRKGGRLIIDLFDPRLDLCHPGARALGGLRRVMDPASGNSLAVRARTRRLDPVLQIMRETWEFCLRDPAGRVLRRHSSLVCLRWTYRHEMRLLLELSGFKPEACYGDFHGRPPRYGAEQVWVARRG